MRKDDYYQLWFENRLLFQRILMYKLPSTKEGMIIFENLWTLFICRIVEKVKYHNLETRSSALAVLIRQAKDVKFELFRTNAKKSNKFLKDIELENVDVIDKSQSIVELYEQKEVFQKLIDKLPDKEVEFINICLLQGRDYKEVAELYGKTIGAITKRVSRLRKKLLMTYDSLKNC